MTTNVDGYEIWRDGPDIVMRFVDIFEQGEEIKLPLHEAKAFFTKGIHVCLEEPR